MIYLEGNMAIYSSLEKSRQLLVTILMDLANMPDFPPAGTVVTQDTHYKGSIKRLRERYPGTFSNCTEADMFGLRHLLRKAWASTDLREKEWCVFLLRQFHAQAVRRAQAVQEHAGRELVREWEWKRKQLDDIFELRSGGLKKEQLDPFIPADTDKKAALLFYFVDAYEIRAATKGAPPFISDFERAAFYLQRNLHRARLCRNKACNVTPYFFIRKKNQLFCSETCSLPALLAAKRKWWQENRGKSKRRKQK